MRQACGVGCNGKWEEKDDCALSRGEILCCGRWCPASFRQAIWSLTLLGGLFSTAVTFFTVLCSRVSVGSEADPECFRLTKVLVVKAFPIAAHNVGTDAELRREEAEAVVKVTSLVPKVGTPRPACSPPEKLQLY